MVKNVKSESVSKNSNANLPDAENIKIAPWRAILPPNPLDISNTGNQRFDERFIQALIDIKRAFSQTNYAKGVLSKEHSNAIIAACDILSLEHGQMQFLTPIWQSGSDAKINMEVNDRICSHANLYLKQQAQKQGGEPSSILNANSHVNMSQSANDLFPSAMHIAVAFQTRNRLLPLLEIFDHELHQKQKEFSGQSTIGRTYLMDAIPISIDAILSAYRNQLECTKTAINTGLNDVYKLALGGATEGTLSHAPLSFGRHVVTRLANQYHLPFKQHENLYAAVSGEDGLLRFSGALKQLAGVLLKIANDIRIIGSDPRWQQNELQPLTNSLVLSGKVNAIHCEAMGMACLQVFGNDLTVSLAASNGQLQSNTYRPVIIHNVMESIELLSNGMASFSGSCIRSLRFNHMQ